MWSKMLSQLSSLGSKKGAEEQAPATPDFGSNAAAQEQLAASKDGVYDGKLGGLKATQNGTEVSVDVGQIPGFNVYWTVLMDGGRRSHALVDLVEPLSGHGPKTPWSYDGQTVTFVVPYSFDQVKGMGNSFQFVAHDHALASKGQRSEGSAEEATGKVVRLQKASDGRTTVGVHVRGGTDVMGTRWTAIMGDGRHRIDLADADVRYRGDMATFKVDLSYDTVLAMSREVRFEK